MNNPTFAKARAFMYRNARPLDLARFQYHFEGGSREAVLNVLSCYQNADGGCGHAVEADCWNPNSTPLHSNTASDIIREIGFDDADHPFIRGLVRYYSSGKDFDGKHWSITVASNNDYPHAQWCHTDSVSTCHTDYNGTAQIAGFLICFAPAESEAFRLGVRVAGEAIDALSPETIIDMHTCTCYVRLMDFIRRAGAEKLVDFDRLRSKLHASVNKLIVTDKTQWSAYMCKPSQFFDSRESEFYLANCEIAEYECEFIENTQLDDGSWDVPWHWEGYPEEWAVSKNWWKGAGIIQNLLYLKGFGRL